MNTLIAKSKHEIYFCIKDKEEEKIEKRHRVDSLQELTAKSIHRSRTKSQAIQDVSNSNLCEFV